MPEHSSPDHNVSHLSRDSHPLTALDANSSQLSPTSPLEPEPQSPSEFQGSTLFKSDGYRRRKAAVLLIGIWGSTIALHLFSWGLWVVLGMTTVMGFHILRVFFAKTGAPPEPLQLDGTDLPFVSVLVAAKNEESAIAPLVKMLCSLDYPGDLYEVWAIDDQSTDQTPELLDQLAQEYSCLKVLHRTEGATGGKSGALNQALALAQGDIIAVFDADARVTADLLRRVLPLFNNQQVGAVQVRKAISNGNLNFLTRGQVAEMALDSFFQQHRIALGGIGELRGNGQFVRRTALTDCGGWNEETITDDLDLTLRLHLRNWDIEFLLEPPVQEEGVTQGISLWHQRNRWAEGGYQRYLDYWRLLFSNRLGWRKSWDMLIFWLFQYFLPNAAVPDCVMALVRNRPPVYSPLTALALSFSAIAMFSGLRRLRQESPHGKTVLVTLLQTLRGMIYLLHWFAIVASTSARMSLRPKRLKWVKTVHQGVADHP